MGRHSKPNTHRVAKTFTAVGGAVAGLAATTGVACAETGPPGGWKPIAMCESGLNPRAQNPESTASGILQFIDGTWRSNGGGRFSSHAKGATVEQQFQVAAKVFREQGLRPWDASKHCWGAKVAAAKRRGDPAPMTASPDEMLHPGKHNPQPAPAGAEHHMVQPGDTLSQIAMDHGVTWQELFAANRAALTDPNVIFPGMNLQLP